MKRSQDIDIEGIFESLQSERAGGDDHEHPEWDDLAEEADDQD